MLQRIKKVCVLFVLIAIWGGIVLFGRFKTTKVHDGITREVAIEKCAENENYYMVKFSEGNTGLTYVISEGEDKGVEVELTGNAPQASLSDVFMDGRNEFLVYGYDKNEDHKSKNVSTLEELTYPYTINVESWELVTPIYRDYTYSSHGRILYPKGYIDSYDLQQEDFILERDISESN